MADFQPLEQGESIESAVTVTLANGQLFHGWESISVTRSIESIANTFSITYDNRFDENPGELWPLRPGLQLSIAVDGDPLMKGHIETISASFGAENKSVKVSGRSLAGDIVDSSAEPKQFLGQRTIDKIAEELVSPYGLKIFLSVIPGQLTDFSTKPGETVFSALDRAAKTLGFLWVSTRAGNLRLTQAGTTKGASDISENFNMLSGSMSINNSMRFQTYKAIGQRSKPLAQSDLGSNIKAEITQPKATATDEGIDRVRNLTVIAENNVDPQNAVTRAQWEASTRIAKSFSINSTVDGWKDQGGTLWDVNQLIRVKSSLLGINEQLLTSTVNYTKSNSGGTIANIKLVRPDSYLTKPVFTKEDDPTQILGTNFK